MIALSDPVVAQQPGDTTTIAPAKGGKKGKSTVVPEDDDHASNRVEDQAAAKSVEIHSRVAVGIKPLPLFHMCLHGCNYCIVMRARTRWAHYYGDFDDLKRKAQLHDSLFTHTHIHTHTHTHTHKRTVTHSHSVTLILTHMATRARRARMVPSTQDRTERIEPDQAKTVWVPGLAVVTHSTRSRQLHSRYDAHCLQQYITRMHKASGCNAIVDCTRSVMCLYDESG